MTARDGTIGLNKLTDEELLKCEHAFKLYDRDGNRSIDVYELREALKAVGLTPTEKELLGMIQEVDQNGNQTIEYREFCDLILRYKEPTIPREEDGDILDAFVAMGGRYDGGGEVSTVMLKNYFDEFGLNIDIDKLVADIDKDQSGYVDFYEFKELLSMSSG